VLLILVLVGIVWFVIWLFTPNSNTDPEPTADTTQQEPTVYANVQFVQDGEITAPENHYSIIITVNNASRTISIYNAYKPVAIKTQSYPNSQVSYDSFYAALNSSGFFATRENKAGYDRAGYCPLGIRYDYKAGKDISFPDFSSWSASCNARAGTFAGDKSQVKKLFTNQIPNYTEYIDGVSL
jgi:hypothetical protein